MRGQGDVGTNDQRRALSSVLEDVALETFQIGSAVVPGLAAKPIIDILVAASSLAAVADRQTELVALGYLANGENGIAGRRSFQKGGAQRSRHLHVSQHGELHLHRALAGTAGSG
ncbi:MAG: GrpB family protein [Permianibacter sp.]